MITRVGSVTLEVPDLAASVRFFEDEVGLAVTQADRDTAYLRATAHHHDMILARSEDGRTALRHLNLEVADGTLDEHVQRAIDTGATDVGPVEHAGITRAHVVEIPGGFGVKLYEGMRQVEEPPPSELPRPLRFSHFNIGLPDAGAQLKFLVEAFGLRHSDWIGSEDDPFIGWLHCPAPGSGHHGVAVLKTDDVRLHHIAFYYEDISEVAARVDHYVDAEHYLVWGMGRHGTGGSVFSYIEDPSGMMVELGSGMIIIGRDPRWTGPRVWALDDQRGVDEWGSTPPDAWLAKHVDVRSPRSLHTADALG